MFWFEYSANFSAPENVRDLRHELFFDKSNETYNGLAAINFTYPCNTYGKFEYFEIYYMGYRKDFSNHTNTDIMETDGEYWIALKPEFNYAVWLTVRNSAGLANTTSISFLSPTGGKLGFCSYNFVNST